MEDDDEKMILCKALNIMKRTIEQKDELIESQKPKVLFADAVTACDDSILIRDLAKLITQNGINIGQNRLFYWLRLNGYLFKRETRPIQKWVEQGLFKTNISLIETHHGTMERCTTKVTGKGQHYFVNGFVTGRFKADNQQCHGCQSVKVSNSFSDHSEKSVCTKHPDYYQFCKSSVIPHSKRRGMTG